MTYRMSNGIDERDMTPEEIAELLSLFPAQQLEQPKSPVLCCLANLTIAGFDISGIESATGLTFAMVLDAGVVWVFFTEPMESESYSWNVSSSVGRANVTATTVDYIEITVVDNEGNPADSARLAVQIFKVQ